MRARAESLAKQFEGRVAEMTTAIERLSDADWKKLTAAEKWSVGVTAHHVAGAHRPIEDIVKAVATGQATPPYTMAMLPETDGDIRNHPYDIPNVRIEWVNEDFGVPLGFWRSVGPSQNGFIVDSFVDEVAHLGGQDPYEYPRSLLGKRRTGAPLPAGRERGIAVCFSYGSYATLVAEVSVGDDGQVIVHKVVCAIDGGIAVNPDQVQAQGGGLVYGLTATLFGEITVDHGRVRQTKFNAYPMLRINQTPVTEVQILDSGQAPGGLGEPGVPTVASAVCTAIFAATGKRVRRLPIRPDDLKKI